MIAVRRASDHIFIPSLNSNQSKTTNAVRKTMSQWTADCLRK